MLSVRGMVPMAYVPLAVRAVGRRRREAALPSGTGSSAQEPTATERRHTKVLAPMLGFFTFLLLLPAREDHLDIDYGDRPGVSVRHCYTHLGWEDVLGPLSCSRWAAASVGISVALAVRGAGQWRSRRKAALPRTGA